MNPIRLKRVIAIVAAIIVAGAAVSAFGGSVKHNLRVRLDLKAHMLSAIDQITITGHVSEPLEFLIAPQVDIKAVAAAGHNIPFRFTHGLLRIGPEHLMEAISLIIEYDAHFDDKTPAQPLNTDNPGYGVIGTILPQGVVLLPGSRWYPQSRNDATMDLTVDAPQGVLAVTSGQWIGHQKENDRTLSRWRVDPLFQPVSLVAGPFQRRSLTEGDVSAATYFTSPLQSLADRYLGASTKYLSLYQELFGPMAFNQFAVVENFFPTGYGFPGFTLMGRRVLQLPFIIKTSLGHEIAHCWWGNGVLVDFDHGNWSEGLTTYVAEYLYEERLSAESARQHRLQWLRNYANLVPPDQDFALAAFTSRTNPVTRTIGYDKSAMVFHMLRQKVGDKVFWQTLGDLYRQRRFQPTSWQDLHTAFTLRSGLTLDHFFHQWVMQTGAPDLKLRQVAQTETDNGFEITGRIAQSAPVFTLTVPVEVQQSDGVTLVQMVKLIKKEASFRFRIPKSPRRLSVDPQHHLFRRLAPEEIPPSINTIKGADRITIVVKDGSDHHWTAMARRFKIAMGLSNAVIKSQPPAAISHGHVLVWFGLPEDKGTTVPHFKQLKASRHRFVLNGRTYDRSRASFFGVFEHHGRPIAVFLPADNRATADRVSAKITHYGKYSYLTFEGSQNRDKGTWPMAASPLEVRWPDQ